LRKEKILLGSDLRNRAFLNGFLQVLVLSYPNFDENARGELNPFLKTALSTVT
jgi:hypothetical protein